MIDTPAWHKLQQHHRETAHLTLRTRFASQPDRFDQLSLSACGLLLDYSKNRLDTTTIGLLVDLARAQGVEALRDAMFEGHPVNATEGRPALHTALRAASSRGDPISLAVRGTLERMRLVSHTVRSGVWKGYDGRPIRAVVHLGIGGSHLGPRAVCAALADRGRHPLDVRFVANVDAHELEAALHNLEPATTLFIVASKTFTTAETMMNAHGARFWCETNGMPAAALPQHFIAVSANEREVAEFGLDPRQMLPMWDWVGGRFSLWSAIGLPIAMQCGMEAVYDLHAGARAMDHHFRTAPLAANMPVLLALVGLWNIDMLGLSTLSIAPYHHLLRHLPAHLQQLEMESNGKSVRRDGSAVDCATAPVIWGQAGTNGQHAYFQWLHQGRADAAVDFIAVARPRHANDPHHRALLANCLAQSEALMEGRSAAEVDTAMAAEGMDAATRAALVPHKVFPGNRPSNTLLLPRLDAYTLGSLLALYEHKVVVQGALWGINSFDQWGVEWGKDIARRIEGHLDLERVTGGGDKAANGSTRGLIAAITRMRGGGH